MNGIDKPTKIIYDSKRSGWHWCRECQLVFHQEEILSLVDGSHVCPGCEDVVEFCAWPLAEQDTTNTGWPDAPERMRHYDPAAKHQAGYECDKMACPCHHSTHSDCGGALRTTQSQALITNVRGQRVIETTTTQTCQKCAKTFQSTASASWGG